MTRSDAVQNRAKLLAIAKTMIDEGEAEPAFNTLAKRAGMGVGTVYRHFADHKALLAGLGEAQVGVIDALTAQVDAEADPLVALELLLRGAVAMELDSPVIGQLLAIPEMTSQLTALNAAGERVIARGKKAKLLRADLKRGDLRRLVCGIEKAIRTGDDQKRSSARFVAIVLAGLRSNELS